MLIDFLCCLLRYSREVKDTTIPSRFSRRMIGVFSLAVGFLGTRADIPPVAFLLALFLFWVEGLAL
jgi:hypothetical protein